MMAATQHDVFAEADYARLRQVGMTTARDTVRWHLIERPGGEYDFSSFDPMFSAAQRQHNESEKEHHEGVR